MKALKVSEEQVLYFRGRRGFLAGESASSIAEAAGRIVGAQSQQLAPSLHALSLRTKSRPTATEIKNELFQQPRSIVRSWGQRDTLFVYRAEDWPRIVAAASLFSPGGRGGPMPTDNTLEKARKHIEEAGCPVTRTDMLKVTPASYVKVIANHTSLPQTEAKRFAAGRLIWRLAHQGHLCVAEKQGAEQGYAARSLWQPNLKWKRWDPEDAAQELVRAYLRVHGPATPHDAAHFFGARITMVRQWIRDIENELTPVQCDEREGLLILNEDVATLRRKPSQSVWPARLLPAYEALLMAHADKVWTVPIESERKLIWRKSAIVAAVVLDRGRAVGTWTQKATKTRLTVSIQPLSAWRKSKHLPAIRREATALAQHLEVNDRDVSIDD